MKTLVLSLIGAGLLALAACGGSSGQSFAPGQQPVQAQSGFSSASLTGTYGVSFVGAQVGTTGLQGVDDGIGTLQFNGSGSITGGSVTQYTSSGTCQLTLSGTYSVSSTGALTATLNSTSSTPSVCTGSASAFSGQVSQNGDTAVFAESDGSSTGAYLSGTAIKQQ